MDHICSKTMENWLQKAKFHCIAAQYNGFRRISLDCQTIRLVWILHVCTFILNPGLRIIKIRLIGSYPAAQFSWIPCCDVKILQNEGLVHTKHMMRPIQRKLRESYQFFLTVWIWLYDCWVTSGHWQKLKSKIKRKLIFMFEEYPMNTFKLSCRRVQARGHKYQMKP